MRRSVAFRIVHALRGGGQARHDRHLGKTERCLRLGVTLIESPARTPFVPLVKREI
jgi:hypothetical protein